MNFERSMFDIFLPTLNNKRKRSRDELSGIQVKQSRIEIAGSSRPYDSGSFGTDKFETDEPGHPSLSLDPKDGNDRDLIISDREADILGNGKQTLTRISSPAYYIGASSFLGDYTDGRLGVNTERDNEENMTHTTDGLSRNSPPNYMKSSDTEACSILDVICWDRVRYKKLLQLQGGNAQFAMDIMQMILDSNITVSTTFRSILLKAILRLSKRSMLYPRSYVLTDVKRDAHPVASGHFGEVYQGYYNGRKVSLKVFKLYSSQMSKRHALLKAFFKEAILWRHLNNCNLLPFYGIYQLGDSGGRICLVSPWMDNGNATEYLERNPEVNRNHLESMLLALDIAQGIAYLHEQSIIHGDLKGTNVLISNNDVACLADFGLSSVVCQHSLAWTSIETTVSTAGTVRWQAPELLVNENSLGATKESDMYAFACVLYEIYTGKVPFYQFPLEASVIRQIMLGNRPTRPGSNDFYAHRGLTDWIWSFIGECWREDPAVRLTALEAVDNLSLQTGFLRLESAGPDNWGDLHSETFKSLVDQQSRMTEEEVQRSISLLKSL